MNLFNTASSRQTALVHLLVLGVLLAVVFALNIFAGGTITNPHNLAVDLASPPASPQVWDIQNWPVVKYRALFRLVVRGTWSALFAPDDAWAFYGVFVTWSFVFFLATLVAFYFYLRLLEFDPRASFVGGLLFLFSPPVLLAYKYPVYTREDPLAYFLFLLALIAMFKSRAFLFALISTAAALTRETTLLLPLVYFLTARESRAKRILVCLAPFLALAGIRVLWGFVVGNNFESAILNLLSPFETLAFMFLVFGALWVPYWLGLREGWQSGRFTNEAWRILTASGPVVLVLMLAATLLLSRAREIRITFLLFPWAIPFALAWFRTHFQEMAELAANPMFSAFSFSVMASISAIILYFHLTNPELMRSYLADFKNGYWLFLGAFHLSATVALCLPLLRRTSPQSV
jgi:hypothetical protein